jgi:hypothetical protein
VLALEERPCGVEEAGVVVDDQAPERHRASVAAVVLAHHCS